MDVVAGTPQETAAEALTEEELTALHAWWRAANYLSVGQIYLMGNPLLREPRLLGHWGTTPGLNFIYAHLNRVIASRDINARYVMGPGHGGPGPVASAWLEGNYSEVYPDVSRDAAGMRRLLAATRPAQNARLGGVRRAPQRDV